MTSYLHFELFMRELRLRSAKTGPQQFPLQALQAEGHEDVGSLRLSRIEAAMKETRADRTHE
jgi:hypothetical protein